MQTLQTQNQWFCVHPTTAQFVTTTRGQPFCSTLHLPLTTENTSSANFKRLASEMYRENMAGTIDGTVPWSYLLYLYITFQIFIPEYGCFKANTSKLWCCKMSYKANR